MSNVFEYFLEKKDQIIEQLKYAKENIPFYKTILEETSIDSIKDYIDFVEKIPILEEEILTLSPKLFSSDQPIEFVRHSSSTTDKPKEVFLTKKDLDLWIKEGRLTLSPYFKEGMKVAYASRQEEYYLSALKETVEFSNGHTMTFDPKDIESILRCVRGADIIMDYAEMIYYISEILSKEKIDFDKELILSYTGAKLTDSEVSRIKENFAKAGVRVQIYSEYATTEIGPIGCSDNINPNKFKLVYKNICFVEIIDPLTKRPSKKGDIIVTTLGRTGSVFIRYKVGDSGKISFQDGSPYIEFDDRKFREKVASLHFHPGFVFRKLRKILDSPLYCEISLKYEKYKSLIKLKVFSEEEFNNLEKEKIKLKLLEELEMADDLNSTITFDLSFIKTELDLEHLKKGYKFVQVD